MRDLRLLGLAAVTALGLMALVGAGTASATTLCTSVTGSACSTGADYGAGQQYDWSLRTGTSAKFRSGPNTVLTCTASTIKGQQTNTTATWIVIDITEWSFPLVNCSLLIRTVTPGRHTFMWTSGTSGTVEGDESEFTLEIFGVTCTYGFGGGTHLGTSTGGAEPILSISTTVSKTAGGFLCPASLSFEAEYVLTEPHTVFVVN